jgi:hypothetical protein
MSSELSLTKIKINPINVAVAVTIQLEKVLTHSSHNSDELQID